MKKTILVTAFLLAVVWLRSQIYASSSVDDFSYFSNHFANKTISKITNKIELLFVQNALHASMVPITTKKGCMTLSVWPTNTNIRYFSNEPARISGTISPAHFVTLWKDQGTASSPFIPNVDIQGVKFNAHKGHYETYNVPAALGEATYDAKALKMTYKACPIGGGKLEAIHSLDHVTIFFDQFTPYIPNG